MGGGTEYYKNEVIDYAPDSAAYGLNLYSGPQGSLAGSLPSWVAPYNPGVAYQKGHIVYFEENWDDGGSVESVASLPLIKSFIFNKSNLYVKTTENLDRFYVSSAASDDDDGPPGDDASGKPGSGGWKTFAALEEEGWDTGFVSTEINNASLPLSHHEIILNLGMVHMSKNKSSSGDRQTKYIKCRAVLNPPEGSSSDQIALIPSDRVTIAGAALRSPKTINQDTAGEAKVISGDYPSFIVPTIMYKPKEGESGTDISYEEWKELSSADERAKYEGYALEDYNIPSKLKTEMSPTFDPQYAEARNSLRAYLSSSYIFSTPLADESMESWNNSKDYKIGEAVAHSFDADDAAKADAQRQNKDVVWICIQDHSNQEPPKATIGDDGEISDQDDYWSNLYWRPYGLVMNSPNSSIANLWDAYRNQGELGTGTTSSPENSLGGQQHDSLRKRMSDMIGGSRIYGQLTLGPSRTGQRVVVSGSRRMWRRRVRYTYGVLPPGTSGSKEGATESGARADLWLFPNTLKKDHGGQIRYAVQFGDVTTFSAVRLKGAKKGFFARFMYSIFGRRRYKGSWSSMPEERSDPSEYIKVLKGMDHEDSPISRTFSRLENTYGYIHDTDWSNSSAGGGVSENTEITQENDIIRFEFTRLKPFHTDPNVSTMDGQYNIIIQDLNAGNLVSTSFRYRDICERPSDSRTDAFENQFLSGRGKDCNMNQSNTLNSQYREAVQNVSNMSGGSEVNSEDIKILSKRNYYNYLIFGHADPSNTDRSSCKGLVIWSMDLSEDQFDRAVGTIHTGFRGVKISEDNDAGQSLPQGLNSASNKMDHILDIPDSVDENSNFIVGDDINSSSNSFIQKITKDRPDWEPGKYYDAGLVVKHNSNHYFSLRCHTSGTSFSEGSDWKKIDQIDYQIKKIASLSEKPSLAEGWSKILNSPLLQDNEKLKFEFGWSPAVRLSAVSAFFTGILGPTETYNALFANQYSPGTIVRIPYRPLPAVDDTEDNQFTGRAWGLRSSSDLYYKLKQSIPSSTDVGAVPGYRSDPNWNIVKGFSSHMLAGWVEHDNYVGTEGGSSTTSFEHIIKLS
ncbi:MAG: hypothetical protein CL885_00185 [Dehalococcoidia bacterium]|nr:hypothetical protein [Dehalococcoidia bacterium]